MEVALIPIVIFIVWYPTQRFVLPRLGVSC